MIELKRMFYALCQACFFFFFFFFLLFFYFCCCFFVLKKFIASDFNIKGNAYREKMLDVKTYVMRCITLMCRTFKLTVFWIHFRSFSGNIN